AKRGALQNAEAMLLIDDDETEVFEFDAFLNEGMSSDEQLGFAACGALICVFLLSCSMFADQEFNIDAKRRKQFFQVVEMLLGKNFGGGHERGLIPAANRGKDCGGGDGGFSGTHVALQ